MERTRITISYGRTQSLPEYSNIKPAITIEAALDSDDDPEEVTAQLRAEARAFVEEEVDQALEAAGLPAKYSSAPRYQLLTTHTVWVEPADPRRPMVRVEPPELLVIVLPEALRIGGERHKNPWYTPPFGTSRGMRLSHAISRALEYRAEREREERGERWRLVDCSDGDLSRIPAWVTERPRAPEPELTQEAAALAVASWYAEMLRPTLTGNVAVVCCSWDAQLDGWYVEVVGEGLDVIRAVGVRAGEEPRLIAEVLPPSFLEEVDDEG